MISVSEWVSTALYEAKIVPDIEGPGGTIHQERSRRFVEALGAYAREKITDESERVLTKHHKIHRSEFGLNELLFDVLWCETATTPAAEANVLLRYVTRGKWAVESEFARDSRQAIFDFNKLVLANTEAKLFIGPITRDWQAFLALLGSVAVNVIGLLYVALVPHPADWNTPQERQTLVFRWSNGGWVQE